MSHGHWCSLRLFELCLDEIYHLSWNKWYLCKELILVILIPWIYYQTKPSHICSSASTGQECVSAWVWETDWNSSGVDHVNRILQSQQSQVMTSKNIIEFRLSVPAWVNINTDYILSSTLGKGFLIWFFNFVLPTLITSDLLVTPRWSFISVGPILEQEAGHDCLLHSSELRLRNWSGQDPKGFSLVQ